jgi:hypothetical protein
MTNEPAAMRAWLDTHGLADAELLHHLANQDPDGNELTNSERQLLSVLLEARRVVVPGYRSAPADRSTIECRPGSAEPPGLFDPGPTRPPERAVVQPADRQARPPLQPERGRHSPPLAARRPAHRDREAWER